jgi:hypothetical protein
MRVMCDALVKYVAYYGEAWIGHLKAMRTLRGTMYFSHSG